MWSPVRETSYDPLRWELWELICGGDSRLDIDDVVYTLERHGWFCPEDLKEEG